LAEYRQNPKVVTKLKAAQAKLAGYKAKALRAKGDERKKYQKLEQEALDECNKWYNLL
jgi:hypothetical protein